MAVERNVGDQDYSLQKLDELFKLFFESDQHLAERCLSDTETRDLVFYGAGKLGRKLAIGLQTRGIIPKAFVDDNPELLGKYVEGVKVVSIEDAVSEFATKGTFVVSIWRGDSHNKFVDILSRLESLGCQQVIPFSKIMLQHPDIFLPYYGLDLPEKLRLERTRILEAFQLMSDGESKSTFYNHIYWKMYLDFSCVAEVSLEEQYFPFSLFNLLDDEVFVDCGAYDGDTIRTFLHHRGNLFNHIVAVEPDPINFLKLQSFADLLDDNIRERINIYPCAIGQEMCILNFNSTGTVSSSIDANGTNFVDCCELSAILNDKIPTFIKMDIEGGEMEALIGAQSTIKNNLPILAISVYHRFDDLWRIPCLIKKISKDYRIYLRAHLAEGWEVVCYAIPLSRCKKN